MYVWIINLIIYLWIAVGKPGSEKPVLSVPPFPSFSQVNLTSHHHRILGCPVGFPINSKSTTAQANKEVPPSVTTYWLPPEGYGTHCILIGLFGCQFSSSSWFASGESRTVLSGEKVVSFRNETFVNILNDKC